MGPIAYLRQKLLNIELQLLLKKFRNFLKGLRTALIRYSFLQTNQGKKFMSVLTQELRFSGDMSVFSQVAIL